MKWTPAATALALSVLTLGLTACDKATPVAPKDAVLKLTANPLEISGNGSTTLTIEARKPDGNAVNPGTEIRLSTTLGTLSSDTVETDASGIARATLTGDGRFGEASLFARSGSSESGEVKVRIGRLAGSVTLTITPQTVGETGGTVNLTAFVRDEQGQPVPGVPTNFRTEAGRLQSAGNFRNTNDQGVLTDRLTISELDLAVLSGDSFKVFVEASASGGSPKTADATITIARPPDADFNFAKSGCTVTFTDTSQRRPTAWQWDFGDDETSTQQNPVHEYSAAGDYIATLTVFNAVAPQPTPCGGCVVSKTIRLTTTDCN